MRTITRRWAKWPRAIAAKLASSCPNCIAIMSPHRRRIRRPREYSSFRRQSESNAMHRREFGTLCLAAMVAAAPQEKVRAAAAKAAQADGGANEHPAAVAASSAADAK